MDKKLKNAIRESFVFPESKHKEDFFAQVGASYAEKRKRRFPVASRLAAAAAALLIGIGIYGASKLRTDFDGNDTEHTAQPTTVSIAVTEDSTAQPTETSTASVTGAVSAATTLTAATTARVRTTAAARTNITRTAKATAQARTTAPVHTPAEAETTTISEYEEGSVTMKKMIAFLSAMGIAATANPTGVYAENPNKIRFSWGETSWFSSLQETNWKYDMNSDGDFDIEDIFELKLYSDHVWHYWQEYREDQSKYTDMYKYYDEQTFKHVKKIMHNENLIYEILPFDIRSVNQIARYYLYINGEYPTTDEIREALRDYDFMTVDGPDHVDEFIEYMEKLRSEVKTYEDKDYTEAQLDCFRRLDSGETEKDVNGDGEFNYFDVYDILGYVVNADVIARNRSIELDGVPMSDELNARVEQYGDMNLNGEIDSDDFGYLALYLDKMNLKPLPITDHLKVMKTYTVSGAKEVNDEMNRYNALDYSLGDVDNSGSVNAIDASLVLDYYSKTSTGQSTGFDDTQKKSADVNKDDSINAVDASEILSYYAYTATANGSVMTLEEYINS
ncbi:dockerin type I domain-containing protein [Ruminococcus sp.]|uniref:dockerin type I domain-containing protein n=1 Tax=Ruminococcus sp. TaxID=41978 RepID=UPI0025F006F4|nr:dockerin type I domain-containing protein [Ruminococcus sp.]MCR4638799.1 hypothetical protein [Ruminococcus sp.]